jgi:hypothetical protein
MGRKRRRRGNAKKKKEMKSKRGTTTKKRGDHGFSPGPGGLCCCMRGERAEKELDRKGGFSLSLSFSLSRLCIGWM